MSTAVAACPAVDGSMSRISAYTNRGCRCTECTEAWRKRKRDRDSTLRETRVGRAKAAFAAAKSCKRKAQAGFDLTIEDFLDTPTNCPICDVRMERGLDYGGANTSPSLDRIRPDEGYTATNTWWICYRCNRIKQDATPTELRRIADVVEAEIAARTGVEQ